MHEVDNEKPPIEALTIIPVATFIAFLYIYSLFVYIQYVGDVESYIAVVNINIRLPSRLTLLTVIKTTLMASFAN